MKPDTDEMTFGEILAELEALVRNGSTGSVYIMTDSRHYARFGIKSGRIAHCVFGRYHGEDALPYIRQIRSGRFTFAEGVVSSARERPLPPTAQLMQWLSEAISDKGSPQRPPEPPHAVGVRRESPRTKTLGRRHEAKAGSESVSKPDGTVGGTPLRINAQDLYQAVAKELAFFLGPIAAMVIDDHKGGLRSVTNREQLHDVISQISDELDDPAMAQEFRNRILRLTE